MSQKTIRAVEKVVKTTETVTICDICGHEYTDHEEGGFLRWDSTVEFYWRQDCHEGGATGWRCEDVCPACADKIRDFVESLGAKVSAPYEGILAKRKGPPVAENDHSSHTTRCIRGLRARVSRHHDEYLGIVADEMQRVYDLMAKARRALLTIEELGCERTTLPVGACYEQGYTEDAEFEADRCCAPCIAHKALAVEGSK